MRVRISATSPLPQVKSWFPLHLENNIQTISSFKTILCTSLPAFHGLSPSSFYLSIDGFELLDTSELSIVRDGDLICVNHLGKDIAQATQKYLEPDVPLKRKRPMSSSSESESDTSDSESDSDSDEPSRPTTPSLWKPPKVQARAVQPKPQPPTSCSVRRNHLFFTGSTFVPPGYGKPQTRSRNLRRRLKRIHEHDAVSVSEGGPVSGANAVAPSDNAQTQGITPEAGRDVQTIPALLSLSLRNKNKARNFKSLIGRPLPPKIVFEDASMATFESKSQVLPRLIPPSSRSWLPPNVFVTSIDVEAGLRREKKSKMRIEYGNDVSLCMDTELDVDKLESIAAKQWDTLAKPRERQVKPGTIVGYKGLGINPVTYTPEQLLTVGSVVSCESETVVVRALRGVSFSGPIDGDVEEERHTWDDIERGDWRIIQ